MDNLTGYRFLIILISILTYSQLNAQLPENNDSVKNEKNIKSKDQKESKDKNGIYRFIQKTLTKKSKPKEIEDIQKRPLPLSGAEGKIIRNIKIHTSDPFGYSIDDPNSEPERFLEKAGNMIHIKTKNFVIKSYLLFDKGSEFDSVKITESERLIRSQRFIRKVRIDYEIVGENNDSIDIVVNTLDSWTLFPSISFSGSKVGFRLRERNFMGWGHDFDNFYRQNFETGQNQFKTRYTIPNIRQTFISLGVGYSTNEDREYIKGITLQRKFFSPLTRWAGGILVGERAYLDSIPNNLGIKTQEIKYSEVDLWGSYAFRLFDKNKFQSKLTNLIVSARYFDVSYREIPTIELDPSDFYSNQKYYLMGIGISKRAFVQDKFIRNYNIIEDIPIGMSVGIVSGIQKKNNINRFYLSGGMKMGNYFNFGFAGFNLQYGGFMKSGRSEQSVFSLQFDYFTRLMNMGRWKFRSFVSSDLIIGNNRADSRGDRLTLNESDPLGINGFYSVDVIGTKKWLTDFQVQSYSPYQFLGFRLSPIFSSSFGLISGGNNRLMTGKLYTRIGLGLLLTNDYLVFSNFQVSFSWYNHIPGQGENLFKSNTLEVSDFELMDFDLGKPQLIEYSPYTPR